MGASDIATCLKKRDPITFGQISRNTIEGWINQVGNLQCNVSHGFGGIVESLL